ncbi:MAG TPA: CPBP family intramembrane metalloprotease [Gemmatales bacterium]|nr:CPBP family intramembrane metalloprotease [Gemmatales bacterium]
MLGRHLKGHLFLFDSKPSPGLSSSSGLRLLLIFLLLEAVLGPRLSLLDRLGFPSPAAWVRVPVLLGLASLLVRFFAGVKFVQIGLIAWRSWSVTEVSYFLQVLVIANVTFVILFADQLRIILSNSALWGPAALAIFTNLLWGFYQELVYRGILQTELVRRWGTVPGILVANTLFTFGPLHYYHFSRNETGQAWPMFAGIFLIGLFFSVLFRRSDNLWIVGTLHGLGDCYLDGLAPLGH